MISDKEKNEDLSKYLAKQPRREVKNEAKQVPTTERLDYYHLPSEHKGILRNSS